MRSGGPQFSQVHDLSEESALDSSCGSFMEFPTTSSVATHKGKGKGKRAKSSGATGPTLAHRGKASSLLFVGMPNKLMGLHSWAHDPEWDDFAKHHPYGHNLEMMKAFTPKDVKNGGSLDSLFAAIKAELKVPEGVTPMVEWFVQELHKRTCCIHDYVYLQLPNSEWTLQHVAPGAIPTVPECLKKWLISNKDYIKNSSCELSQHSVNYIMPMSKYFSEMAHPSLSSLAHIFHHPRMLKSIKFLDSIMSVEGSEWMLKNPNTGCHSFGQYLPLGGLWLSL